MMIRELHIPSSLLCGNAAGVLRISISSSLLNASIRYIVYLLIDWALLVDHNKGEQWRGEEQFSRGVALEKMAHAILARPLAPAVVTAPSSAQNRLLMRHPSFLPWSLRLPSSVQR